MVCEEAASEYAYGARARAKTRFPAGVVTPAAPHYLHGAAAAYGDAPLHPAPPVLGVSAGPAGYSTVEVDVALRTVVVTPGLTEDAVAARLHRGVGRGRGG